MATFNNMSSLMPIELIFYSSMKVGIVKSEFTECVTHVQIIGDKIWIHYDGIEDGITVELVAAGVPKDHIE